MLVVTHLNGSLKAMITRFKKPDTVRQFFIGALLITFQAYLAYSAINGKFGIESQNQMQLDIKSFSAEKIQLQAQIDGLRLRIDLLDPTRLDPDMLSEKARSLLSLANPDDVIIPLNTFN